MNKHIFYLKYKLQLKKIMLQIIKNDLNQVFSIQKIIIFFSISQSYKITYKIKSILLLILNYVWIKVSSKSKIKIFFYILGLIY